MVSAACYTCPSSEGEDGERSEPGGGVVRRVKRNAHAQRLAKKLRKTPTDAEMRLWYYLHKKQLDGLRLKRQEPIGSYIADFVCPSRMLIVEVDGGQHAQRQDKDAQRTEWLTDQGYRVIRFWNNDVMKNIEGVLTEIRNEAESMRQQKYTAPPSTSLRSVTSPSEEGEE